ncbi:kinase-like domain-containing protein [Rhizophagus irregularis DAOM 181602=DAOM 197198]|nr:kinase-like domain-containing protein [Rhizophagus irregularis DAOM 181602=DAOM 197198]
MSEMNEWFKWIEEAIAKKHIKYYEYKYFKNIQEIGIGSFGKVYRAKWKDLPKYFALKSLLNIDEEAIKELINEIELKRELISHDNIINFYGITISDQENQSDDIKKYHLVMEYADSGSLNNYLKENFEKLVWEDKLKFAYQLASAVSCLHDEDIIHRDLHSNKEESYDDCLSVQIMQGHRETTVPDTPIEYVKLYTECWNDNPDNRPSIQEVVERLDCIISNQKNETIDKKTDQMTNKDIVLNSIEESSHRELSQIIQEFNKVNIKEIMGSMTSISDEITCLPENDLSVIINNITEFIFEVMNKNHILAQYFVGYCYLFAVGTSPNNSLAFKYFEKIANKDCAIGQVFTGCCYGNGYGINEEQKLAFHWNEKAANNGNIIGMSNLGYYYSIGSGVEKDIDKAIYWYKKSAEQGYESAQKKVEELMKTE